MNWTYKNKKQILLQVANGKDISAYRTYESHVQSD